MSNLLSEIEANYDKFSIAWRSELDTVSAELEKERPAYLRSYIRLVHLTPGGLTY